MSATAIQTRILGVAPCRLLPGEVAIDLFAGGGGASEGITEALGCGPAVAINHDEHAISMHALNHPDTEHRCESVFAVDAAQVCRGRKVGLLWASPDCTHFSRAKGGKPRDGKIRGLAWIVVTWATAVAPRIICLENVAEFLTWGPLLEDGHPDPTRTGETFREFVAQLRALGYAVDWKILCAADFGAPTIRKRLFLVARRDGLPICWPEPTHGKGRAESWRPAAECIDWSIPCPSIFDRKKPLADATCRRIAAGIVRYVLNGKPFIVNFRGTSPGHVQKSATGTDDPLRTITGCNHHGLVSAFLAKHYTGVVGSDLRDPAGTITAIDHHSLVSGNLIQIGARHEGGNQGLDSPVATLLTTERFALVAAFLVQYYSSGGQHARLNDPLPTVVSKARHGLVLVPIDGVDYVLADIGLRMLRPRELATAQGFPNSYQLNGTTAQQIARIGNSVCPPVAAAVVRAQVAA